MYCIYYISSGLLSIALAFFLHSYNTAIITEIHVTIFVSIVALFAITMPAIGTLCIKIIDLKREFPAFGMMTVSAIKITLYEQTFPVLISPFFIALYPYFASHSNVYFEYLAIVFEVLLYFFFFHSIFTIFDIFKSFISIAITIAKIQDKAIGNDEGDN